VQAVDEVGLYCMLQHVTYIFGATATFPYVVVIDDGVKRVECSFWMKQGYDTYVDAHILMNTAIWID